MTAPWVQTFSGRAFPLLDPKPEDVYWPDIVYGLAHINRFAGHAGTYSVAQHSCVVADQLPAEWRSYGLLHDAHEPYIGDITTPVKQALLILGGDGAWGAHTLARRIDRAIYEAAELTWPVPQTIAEAVHIADERAMVTERRDLMKRPPKGWGKYESVVPLPEHIERWTPEQAIRRYAAALNAEGLDVSFSFLSM